MSKVRGLIAVFALVMGTLPLQASATILNGMKVIWQVDTARTILDNAVAGCPSIADASLRDQCRAYSEDLRSSIELWESNFSAGTLTVTFDANTEETIYSDEVALKNIVNSAGYTWNASASPVASHLDLAPDELGPEPDDFSAGCVACFGAVTAGLGGLTTRCAAAAPGLTKIACAIPVLVGIYLCAQGQVCNPPPAPPKACST